MTRDKAEIILDRCVEYLLYAMIVFIPISIAIIEITFSLALLCFLIKKILRPDFRFVKNPTHLFLFLFFGFCALSLFNSEIYLTKSLKALFFKWFEYIFIFIVVEDTLNTPKRLRNAIFILLAVSSLIAIDGIFQQFRGIDFLRHRGMMGGRITATFQNQNDLAAYLVPLALLSVSLGFLPQAKKQYRWIPVFLGILLCICLILTFSRGAWLGFLVGLFLLAFLSKEAKVFIFLICILFVFISVPVLRQRVSYTFLPGGDSQRIFIIQTAWLIIKENPFLGKGLGTFMDYFPQYAGISDAYYVHNCYLQIWAETGVFSLLSFLGFLGLLLSKGIKIFKKNQDFILLGLICGIFGFLIHSFFDTQLYSLQLAVLFWFMAGLNISLQRTIIAKNK